MLEIKDLKALKLMVDRRPFNDKAYKQHLLDQLDNEMKMVQEPFDWAIVEDLMESINQGNELVTRYRNAVTLDELEVIKRELIQVKTYLGAKVNALRYNCITVESQVKNKLPLSLLKKHKNDSGMSWTAAEKTVKGLDEYQDAFKKINRYRQFADDVWDKYRDFKIDIESIKSSMILLMSERKDQKQT